VMLAGGEWGGAGVFTLRPRCSGADSAGNPIVGLVPTDSVAACAVPLPTAPLPLAVMLVGYFLYGNSPPI